MRVRPTSPAVLGLTFATTLTFTLSAAPAARGQTATPSDPAAARRAFEDMKYGMFLHWGVYSLVGKGEWVMEHDRLPVGEYEKLPSRFQPSAFDADAWVRAARSAGMRYLTVTAKHHDGFCMFDSKLTRYDVVDATPFGRDPMKDLAAACRKHGVTLFFYYSLLDWHHPDYFPLGKTGRYAGREAKGNWQDYVAYYQGQVRELCTNYGPVGGIWFDGWWDRPDADWGLERTYKLIHELQPGAVAGNNHHADPKPGEDFQMFERDLPGGNTAGFNKAAPDSKVAWEYCETLNRSWGYTAGDTRYKSPRELLQLLARSAGHGANLLMNVGPLPDGSLPKPATEVLAEAGRWLEKNGDSIYKTRKGPVPPQAWGVSTVGPAGQGGRPGLVYLHVLDPSQPVALPEALLSLTPRRLGSTTPLKVEQVDGRAEIRIPEADRDPFDTVIVLSPVVLDPETPARRLR